MPRRCGRNATRWRVLPRAARRRIRRSGGTSAIPNFAWYGRRVDRCRLPAAPGPSSRRPASMRRRSPSPASSVAYLLEQLRPLVAEYGAAHRGATSASQEIPYPYVLERGDELAHGGVIAGRAGAAFPDALAVAGRRRGGGRPVDVRGGTGRGRWRCSMRCGSITRCAACVHYTGTDWRSVQPWILLTNYHRYVDQFVRWGLDELATPTARTSG